MYKICKNLYCFRSYSASCIFFIYGPGAKILAFSNLTISRTSLPKLQKIKWPYLGSWATNQKTKDTFFSSTFKVRENKVSLFFHFMAQGPRYWPLFRSRWYILLLHIVIFPIFKGSRVFFHAKGPIRVPNGL